MKKTVIVAMLMSALASCATTATLRDNLWMWGHGAGTTDGLYNIPKGGGIEMADAIDAMGIPNVFVVRWEGKPKPPFDEWIRQFDHTRRVSWSIVDGAPESYEQKNGGIPAGG